MRQGATNPLVIAPSHVVWLGVFIFWYLSYNARAAIVVAVGKLDREYPESCGVARGSFQQGNRMKLKKAMMILGLAMLVMLPACNIGCDVEKAISGGLAGKTAQLLNCRNVANIQRDVNLALSHFNVCTLPAVEHKTGVIANVVCPPLANVATAYVGSKIPADWECDPSSASQTVTMALTTACELLPF
jgi:hypothetical protein